MTWFIRAMVLRQFGVSWRQSLLAVATIALGVAVFLSVRLANRAAIDSFEGFAQGVGGSSDLIVRPAVGPLLDDDLIPLRALGRWAQLSPVIEGSVEGVAPVAAYHLVGVDLVALAGSLDRRDSPAGALDGQDFFVRLQDPRSIFITLALSRAAQLTVGGELDAWVNAQSVRFKVAGIIPESPGHPALERNLILMDLPAAQQVLKRAGQIDRLELALRPGSTLTQLEQQTLQALPEGWLLETPQRRAESGRAITAAFRFNLSLLSALALAVGAYLLFQELDGMVFRRRETWALLHSLGAPPTMVWCLVLLEACVLGIVGSALGGVVGWAMAQGAVHLVSHTVNTLYGPSAATVAQLLPVEAAQAFLLGIGVCVLAALLPARQAARTPPVESLARSTRARPANWPRIGGAGVCCLAAGSALVFAPSASGAALPIYIGVGLVLLGGSLASMLILPFLARLPWRNGAWRYRIGMAPLRNPTVRHVWACASLTMAMSMATGLGIMVTSFRTTVQGWLGQSLQADLYIAPAGFQGTSSGHRLEAGLVREILSAHHVAGGEMFQLAAIQYRGQPVFLGSLALHRQYQRPTLQMLGSRSVADLMALRSSGGPVCFVSESFARQFGIRPGDTVALPARSGVVSLDVLGVYADFSNERGGLVVDQQVFQTVTGDERAVSLALDVAPGADPRRVMDQLIERFPGLQVRANADVRQEVNRIFDRTFAITEALEVIGLIVALAGLAQAMLAMAVLRREQTWTLRALGASDGDIAGTLAIEGMVTALAGTVGGMGLGALLSIMLVEVINPHVFGWTIQFHWPWGLLLGLACTALLTALGALLAVAWWGARIEPDRESEELV